MHEPDRSHIQHAINLISLASNSHQAELNHLCAAAIPRGQAGRVLRISRNIDTLERIAGELSALLGPPAPVGRAARLRSIPVGGRAVDGAA